MKANSRTNSPLFYLIDPSNLTSNVWGGRWLPLWKKVSWPSDQHVGESWEFSTHNHHPSYVVQKKRRIRLDRVLGGASPILTKFIDAQQPLSLQVHPDDRYARQYCRDSGKDESWLILSADQRRGRGYVYVGFNERMRRRFRTTALFSQAFRHQIESKKNILPFLKRLRVDPGDVINVPAGTVHLIGPGVRLFEIQQSSDVTFRLWDWNRIPERSLHIQQGLAVANFHVPTALPIRRARAFEKLRQQQCYEIEVIRNSKRRYQVDEIGINRLGLTIQTRNPASFCALTIIKGRVRLGDSASSLRLREGRTLLVVGKNKRLTIKSLSRNCRILKSYVPAA